ncbi:unnamed protein product [Sphagnum jensenii]|uniref:Uncharacterized protein n=1 Tax=Sphagnum jensenii TaxID=128206 RepID=A0ABP0VK89_9BRYO
MQSRLQSRLRSSDTQNPDVKGYIQMVLERDEWLQNVELYLSKDLCLVTFSYCQPIFDVGDPVSLMLAICEILNHYDTCSEATHNLLIELVLKLRRVYEDDQFSADRKHAIFWLFLADSCAMLLRLHEAFRLSSPDVPDVQSVEQMDRRIPEAQTFLNLLQLYHRADGCPYPSFFEQSFAETVETVQQREDERNARRIVVQAQLRKFYPKNKAYY